MIINKPNEFTSEVFAIEVDGAPPFSLALVKKISDSISWRPNSNFEINRFNKFTHKGAGNSFLMGRIASRIAWESASSIADNTGRVEIHNQKDGTPFFKKDGNVEPGFLSISHKDDVAAAIYSPNSNYPTGIDIEICKNSQAVLELWDESELALINKAEKGSFPEILIWTAKEAMFKSQAEKIVTNHLKIKIESVEKVTSGLLLTSTISTNYQLYAYTLEFQNFVFSFASRAKMKLTPSIKESIGYFLSPSNAVSR